MARAEHEQASRCINIINKFVGVGLFDRESGLENLDPGFTRVTHFPGTLGIPGMPGFPKYFRLSGFSDRN